MKKILSISLAVLMLLCLSVTALAAGPYTVTVINGMDGSVYDTFEVAEGEDFVFTLQGSPPCDMGPIAEGDEGSGVTADGGKITYSNVVLGGPNQYPTAEVVTVSEITGDITVTVTPNPDEVDSEFPAFTLGEVELAASGEPSGEASGEASGDASMEAEGEIEITVDGKTAMAQFAEKDNGDMATKGLTVTFDGTEYTGAIDKGEYKADDAAAQPIFDALKAAREAASGEPQA